MKKKELLFIFTFFFISPSFAQQVSLKKDTILVGNKPFALLQENVGKRKHCYINSFNGDQLIEVHNARIEIKGKPADVVTFLNDKRQAMVVKQNPFPLLLIKELVKHNIIINGIVIDTHAETLFINIHQLPEGYTDIEQLIEY